MVVVVEVVAAAVVVVGDVEVDVVVVFGGVDFVEYSLVCLVVLVVTDSYFTQTQKLQSFNASFKSAILIQADVTPSIALYTQGLGRYSYFFIHIHFIYNYIQLYTIIYNYIQLYTNYIQLIYNLYTLFIHIFTFK